LVKMEREDLIKRKMLDVNVESPPLQSVAI
jgi:hypothetical protein